MEIKSLDQYGSVMEVEFEGKTYVVRDNGAVYRKCNPGRRRSRYDEIWTFGRRVESSGYMHIGSHAVHRIVAFAFQGAPPSAGHIVDHIDSDKSNNCASNLRWVTRLENVIRHPSTRKLITNAYGSLDRFFEDPSSATELDVSISWLRTVSKAEAQRSREQLIEWAESDGRSADGDFVSRVYGIQPAGPPIPEPNPDRQSLTAIAVQRGWKTPAEFPCCPNAIGLDPLGEYERNLRPGAVFSRDQYKGSVVELAEQREELIGVLTVFNTEHAVKPWAVAKVTIEAGQFVHENVGSYFECNGAKKAYFELLGIPFSGESIDNYC